MIKQYIISQPAIRDLEEIVDYFSSYSLTKGEQFINNFEAKCKYLANFPNMGKSYEHLKPFIRGLSLSSYIIFYRIIDQRIEIIRVVSGYRDLQSLFLED